MQFTIPWRVQRRNRQARRDNHWTFKLIRRLNRLSFNYHLRLIHIYLSFLTSQQGTPICDRYGIMRFEEMCSFCVTDGCNWGERPRLASEKANGAFLEFVRQRHHLVEDLHTGALLLLRFESCIHFELDFF